MSDAEPRLDTRPGATDDETSEIASNGERVPAGDSAIDASGARVDDLEQRRTAEDRAGAEPSGTTQTGPAS